jgi:hypothetical protein
LKLIEWEELNFILRHKCKGLPVEHAYLI